MNLTIKILLGMGAGVVVGALINFLGTSSITSVAADQWIAANLTNGVFDAFGSIFVKSLKLMVVPVVFVSLVCGCSALGQDSGMGKIAGKTIALYLFTTAIAISLAIGLALIVQPGVGLELSSQMAYEAKAAPPLKDVFINMFPSNPIQAMADGNMLQIIVFALLFGVGINISGEAGQTVRDFFSALNEVVMAMVTMLIQLAPYGVFFLLAKVFAGLGIGGILDLAAYFFTVLAVLFLHVALVYCGMIKASGLSPIDFLRNIRPAQLFAFSTASSGATLPVTMKVAETRLGVAKSIGSFTLPLGATINMDGTAIMQGVATVFIAQAFAVDIGLGGYLLVILTATMASIGTAAVPGVGLITLAMVLQQVNLPVEGIALIIGVDRLLDMVRTAVNVTGDCTVSTIVARSQDSFDNAVFEAENPLEN